MTGTKLGDVLKERRDSLVLKRSRVATDASIKMQHEWGLDDGFDQNYLGRVEEGKIGQPDKHRLLAITDVLGLPRNEILSLAGFPQEGDAADLPPDVVARLSTLSPFALELLMEYVPMAEKLADRLTVGAGVASGDMHTMNIDTSPQKRARLGRELRGEV